MSLSPAHKDSSGAFADLMSEIVNPSVYHTADEDGLDVSYFSVSQGLEQSSSIGARNAAATLSQSLPHETACPTASNEKDRCDLYF